MPYPTDLSVQQLVTVPRSALWALRSALMRDAGGAYATYLQQAGFAGGDAVFSAFRDWLAARGADTPEALDLDAFGVQAGAFFSDCGWGRLEIGSLEGVAATLDAAEWAEADPDAHLEHPGCHYTAGLFADFFGRVASEPVAVLEVECRSTGAPRCRFLAGSADVMQHVYERMASGTQYEAAVAELAASTGGGAGN